MKHHQMMSALTHKPKWAEEGRGPTPEAFQALLEALENAAEFIKDQDPGDLDSQTGWSSQEHLNAWLAATRAIEKAKGRP